MESERTKRQGSVSSLSGARTDSGYDQLKQVLPEKPTGHKTEAAQVKKRGSLLSLSASRKGSSYGLIKRLQNRADSVLSIDPNTKSSGLPQAPSGSAMHYGAVSKPVETVLTRSHFMPHKVQELSRLWEPQAMEEAKKQAAYLANRLAMVNLMKHPVNIRHSLMGSDQLYSGLSKQKSEPSTCEMLRLKMSAKERRTFYVDVNTSLTKLDRLIRAKKDLEHIPMEQKVLKVSPPAASTTLKKGAWEPEPQITVTTNQQMKDFYRRVQEAAIKRRSLRIHRKWLKAYRKTQTVLRICKNMAERSAAMELQYRTYVDVGDMATATVNYGGGRSIDTESFKARKEISISSVAKDTLTSNPSERTLIQLEDARRELQKVDVFSKYQIEAQEQMLRRAFYITIGPKRIIVKRDQYPEYFYIIICGEAYSKRADEDPVTGETRVSVQQFLKTGQVFGHSALTEARPHVKTVVSRTNMQLLAIHGDDYLNIFWYPTLTKEPPAYITFLSKQHYMDGFPMDLLKTKQHVCTMHHFRRNIVIAQDSKACNNLYIIKSGYCKVFRKLYSKDRKVITSARADKKAGSRKPEIQATGSDKKYIESDSNNISYYTTRSPAGHTVRVPVTKIPRVTDPILHTPLKMNRGKRQFVPLMTLREGDVFGLDQIPVCPSTNKSRSVILVSLGAEVIALKKTFYCRHMSSYAKEVVNRTIIFDDAFIGRRLRERVNRDEHMEKVLKYYFAKLDMPDSEPQEERTRKLPTSCTPFSNQDVIEDNTAQSDSM